MVRIYQGKAKGYGVKVGLVVARFNEPITYTLLAEAQKALLKQGVEDEDIIIAFVPGALEIPQAILKMMRHHELDTVIALGAVIKGETAHFEHVAREACRGITIITTTLETPIINGILTTYDSDQAITRAVDDKKGEEFALAALEMVDLYKEM
ncbi:6,7-dimethyl-8-ribityllumazine synthase [Patescibacteria group bacterium]|nr:6,7-dimethyl-8-ribityllumazine synthase [Patescibacteria group bacterium]